MSEPESRTLVQRFLEAQLAGDRREALRLLVEEGIERGLSVAELHLNVIQAAQYEVGRLWQENVISVAQEHLATSVAQLGIAHLYRYLPREAGNGRRVLLACVEGDTHDMGARVAADFLEMAGFDVHFLGASVPMSSLVKMVTRESPALIALSVTMTGNLSQLRRAVEAVREAAPGVPIVVGGHALDWTPEVADQTGVSFAGPDARSLVDAARRLTADTQRLAEAAAHSRDGVGGAVAPRASKGEVRS